MLVSQILFVKSLFILTGICTRNIYLTNKIVFINDILENVIYKQKACAYGLMSFKTATGSMLMDHLIYTFHPSIHCAFTSIIICLQ